MPYVLGQLNNMSVTEVSGSERTSRSSPPGLFGCLPVPYHGLAVDQRAVALHMLVVDSQVL
jgi:hypothetical protein